MGSQWSYLLILIWAYSWNSVLHACLLKFEHLNKTNIELYIHAQMYAKVLSRKETLQTLESASWSVLLYKFIVLKMHYYMHISQALFCEKKNATDKIHQQSLIWETHISFKTALPMSKADQIASIYLRTATQQITGTNCLKEPHELACIRQMIEEVHGMESDQEV